MRYARSLLLISTILLMPSRPAHSAEIELPGIKTACKSNSVLPILAPVPPALPFLPTASLSLPSVEANQIRTRIAAKQWEQAWTELRQAPWTEQEILLPLLSAMVQAGEAQLASRYLIQNFPPQSENRAKGIGTIAVELMKRDQFQSAIERLKTIPQTSRYLTDAVVPVVRTLASTNQTEKISEVLALFPNEDTQSSLWFNIGREVPFRPDQAQQITGLIQDAGVRSSAIESMARYWLTQEHREATLNAWQIANNIEDCPVRFNVFVDVFDRLKQSGLTLSDAQKARSLDQLATLINQLNRVDLQTTLARLNIEHGRKAQGVKLLEQVTASLKQESYYSRAIYLLEVAKQYQQIGNKTVAVQILDTAAIAADASDKPQSRVVDGISLPMLPPLKEMKYDLLWQIAKQYRSLNQTQKASAIEKRIPKRSLPTIPMIPPLPTIIPAPVPSIQIPQIPRR